MGLPWNFSKEGAGFFEARFLLSAALVRFRITLFGTAECCFFDTILFAVPNFGRGFFARALPRAFRFGLVLFFVV